MEDKNLIEIFLHYIYIYILIYLKPNRRLVICSKKNLSDNFGYIQLSQLESTIGISLSGY